MAPSAGAGSTTSLSLRALPVADGDRGTHRNCDDEGVLVADLINARRPFIDGAWVTGQGPALQVDSPASEQAVASVETTSAAQVEAAILAARRAFDEGPWPRLPMEERLATL